MDSSIWAVLLLCVALLLIFAEVLIPSGGLIFLTSMVFLAAALWSAWQAWWPSHPIAWWLFVLSAILLLPTSVGAAIYVWPYTPIGKMMEPPTQEEVTPYAAEQRRLSALIGQTGEALSPLSPGGIIRVAGERIHAVTEGMIVESGQSIKVLGVQGNRLLVRPWTTAAETTAAHGAAHDAPLGAEPAPLDFDLPPG